MKKLLCYFSFNGFFYEVFINDNDTIFVFKIGHQKETIAVKDYEIIEKIINKIANLKYKFLNTILYNEETLNMYFNAFNNKIYFSKIEDKKEIACSYDNYKFLYDKYNPTMLDEEENNTFKFKVPNSFEFLNSKSLFSRNKSSDATHENITPNPASNKKNDFRTLKIVISGIVLTIALSNSMALANQFQGREINPSNSSYTCEALENLDSPDSVVAQIQESLKDEDPWVVEQAVEDYRRSINMQTPHLLKIETVKRDAPKTLSFRIPQILESIKANENLSEEDKALYLDVSQKYLQNRHYIYNLSESEFNDLCQNIQELDLSYLESPLEIGRSENLAGTYLSKDNTICIFNNTKSVKAHEFIHSLGQPFDHIRIKFVEGFTELNNPYRDSHVYELEQAMNIIYEQIYGEEFWENNLFSDSTFLNFDERFPGTENFSKHFETFTTVGQFMYEYAGQTDPKSIQSNPEALNKLYEIFGKLFELYEEVNKTSWKDNEVLKLCYDKFTGQHISHLHDGYNIDDLYKGEDGNYVLSIGKNVSYTVPKKSSSTILLTTESNREDDSSQTTEQRTFHAHKDINLSNENSNKSLEDEER